MKVFNIKRMVFVEGYLGPVYILEDNSLRIFVGENGVFRWVDPLRHPNLIPPQRIGELLAAIEEHPRNVCFLYPA